MSVVLRTGGSWTRQERNWASESQGARSDSSKGSDAGSPALPRPAPRELAGTQLCSGGFQRLRGAPRLCCLPPASQLARVLGGDAGPAPPHLDDHECQLALQQEEEALADAVGGVPGLGSGRGGGWPCSGPAAGMLQPDVADVHASERLGQTKPPGRAVRGGEAPPRAQEGPARRLPTPSRL